MEFVTVSLPLSTNKKLNQVNECYIACDSDSLTHEVCDQANNDQKMFSNLTSCTYHLYV